MKVFAIVRSEQELARACREICGFFGFLQRKNPGVHICQPLIGIWLHSRMTAKPPSVLPIKCGSSRVRSIAVNESISLSEIWTLCWLNLPAQESESISHSELLDALLRSEPVLVGGKSGKFIPVFPATASDSEVTTVLDHLRRTFPAMTLAGMYLDMEQPVLTMHRNAVTPEKGQGSRKKAKD